MKTKSFNEFYYLTDNKIHDLYEVQFEYEKNNGDISKYKGDMLCPECKTAVLGFTHETSKRRAFLSKLPTSQHRNSCSYINEYASKKELNEYIKSLTKNQIKDRLEATLNILLKTKNKPNNNTAADPERNPFIIGINVGNNKEKKNKTIPRKSIQTWFDREDENEVYIFYGKVKLEVREISTDNTNKKLYILIIKTKKSKDEWRIKTKIFRYDIKDDVDIDTVYDIAIFGSIKFYEKYPQINTVTLQAIMFRESTE